MSRPGNWTREEHILAFNLYSQIPFGTIHVRNPKIQQLAKLLRRSVAASPTSSPILRGSTPRYRRAEFAVRHMAQKAKNKSGANSHTMRNRWPSRVSG